MPLYEYRCTKCAKVLEVIQGFKDAPLRKCESCGGRLQKLISRSGFVLKGSGWYQSDYNAKTTSPKTDASPADAPTGKDTAATTSDTAPTNAAAGAAKDQTPKASGTDAGSGDKPAKSRGKGPSKRE